MIDDGLKLVRQVSMDEVALTEEIPESKLTEHRCSLPGDSFSASVTPRRPIWFLGNEDSALQASFTILVIPQIFLSFVLLIHTFFFPFPTIEINEY